MNKNATKYVLKTLQDIEKRFKESIKLHGEEHNNSLFP